MRLKCLTLNIWDGGKLLEAALEFIAKVDADIIFLQEVYDGKDHKLEPRFKTLTILKNKLEDYDIYYEPEFIDNRSVGQIPQGNAILSKYPIVHKNVIFFDKPLDKNYIEKPDNFPNISRNLIHAVIKTPLGEVDCFNFHGIWDLGGDNYSK